MNTENKDMKQTSEKKKPALNRKYLKIGSFSLAMTAVVVAVVIVLNLFAAELPASYTKLDLTAENLYSIGAETETVLAGVEDDVTFYILAPRGSENQTVTELLGRYTAQNPHIRVTAVDPITNPTFAAKYTSEQLMPNSVIAESAKRYTVIPYTDIFTVQYSEEELYNLYYYGQQPAGTPYFAGELAFTTAVDYVTRDDLPTAYILTGHGEQPLSPELVSYITAENIVHEADFSLLTEKKVPENATTIVLHMPSADLTAEEASLLEAYLREGGHILLVTDAFQFRSDRMPHLAALAESMGMQSVDGLVIETDQKHFMMVPHYLLPDLGPTAEGPLSLLPDNRMYVLAHTAHGIVPAGETDVLPLLSTTAGAYVKQDLTTDTLEKQAGDPEGMVYIGAASSIPADGTRSDSGKFVWFSTPAITDPTAGGNASVFMSSLNWMSENKINLSILAKQMQVEALAVPEADAGLWSVVLIFVLPLATIAGGFAVWFRRRKK